VTFFFDYFAAIGLRRQETVFFSCFGKLAKPHRAYGSSLGFFDAPNGRSRVLDRILYADMKTYLVELLMKQDQMSMAASIESRVPFLDHRLVEFAAGLPARMKLRGFRTKWILREAVRDILPPEILTRKKMGFPVPFGIWMRGPWKEVARDVLLDPDNRQRASRCREGRAVDFRTGRVPSMARRDLEPAEPRALVSDPHRWRGRADDPGKHVDRSLDRCSSEGHGMNILWLNAGLLLPLDKVGKLRTWHLMRHLARRHDVSYLSFIDPSPTPADLEGMREVASHVVTIPRTDSPKARSASTPTPPATSSIVFPTRLPGIDRPAIARHRSFFGNAGLMLCSPIFFHRS
jgi:hypothetical protein